jgi:hypothetical protein
MCRRYLVLSSQSECYSRNVRSQSSEPSKTSTRRRGRPVVYEAQRRAFLLRIPESLREQLELIALETSVERRRRVSTNEVITEALDEFAHRYERKQTAAEQKVAKQRAADTHRSARQKAQARRD